MKIFKLMVVALVAMLGFTACDKDCDHNFIEHDHSEALVGTWTYIAEGGLAEAMVINPNGSFRIDKTVSAQYLITGINIKYNNNAWDYVLTLVKPAQSKVSIIKEE